MTLTLAVFFTVVVWASAFPAIRSALHSYSPGHLALLRFLVASLTLGVLVLIKRPPRVAKKDAARMFLAGGLGIAVYNVFLNYAERTVTAGAASMVVNTAPLWTALLAVVTLGERPARKFWFNLALSFAGVVLVVRGRGNARVSADAWLILVPAIAHSCFIVIMRPLYEKYGSLMPTAAALWSGTICLLPFAPGLMASVRAAPAAATGTVIYLGVGPAALAYATWGFILERVPASKAATFLYLIPVAAFVIAWIWLGEVPSGVTLAGAALVMAALVNNRTPK